jgi:hypothetical protein
MTAEPAALELWLPAQDRFGSAHPLRSLLARGDRLADGPRGRQAALAACFPGVEPLPAAALVRELLAGDAGDATWLAADPAWVQPDMNGARLLAWGRLGLRDEDAAVLAEALRPAFAEAGMELFVSAPERWQLRLPAGIALPAFAAPEQALGEDLFQHLPQGDEGRRWRRLLNEAQILLHQHPWNAARRERGLPPVNSVWLWGGGALPGALRSPLRGVLAEDLLLQALAARAAVARRPRSPETLAEAGAGWLVDLQDLGADELGSDWWPAVQAAAARWPLRLAFAGGERWLHRPLHRWRFWRGGGR